MLQLIERTSPEVADGLVPGLDPDNSPFWEGLQQRQLLLQSCGSCNQPRFPIAVVCPFCGETDAHWKESTGTGEIFSFTEVFLSVLKEFPDTPYVVLSVQLDDGPRIFGRLLSNTPAPAIGARVAMVVERWSCGRLIPAFQFEPTGKDI